MGMMLSLTSVGQSQSNQKYSILYSGNIPNAPYGMGIVFHKNDFSIITTMKFGSSEEGTEREAYSNSGIHQIGQWGNTDTGKRSSYTQNNIFRFDVGLGYRVYDKDYWSIKPYTSVGLTNTQVNTQSYIKAEDISTGYDVLGSYYVKNGSSNKSTTTVNFAVGCLIEKQGGISFGLGYDYNPNGVVVLLGLNF